MGASEQDPPASFPPARFDDYEVVGPLGSGGMGAVYLGRDRHLDRPVALKFLAGGEDDLRRRTHFVVEARAIARLHHPNVVAIYRIGEVAGQPYLAYEFVAGPSLGELPRPVASRRALTIADGVARGLAAAHARGVLHRDIKPANVILGDGDVPKLIDFGLAKLTDGSPDESWSGDGRQPSGGSRDFVSRSAVVVGTPAYMAPELWLGSPASVQADLYAFGLVMWELIVGDLPYPDCTGAEMAAAILHRGVPPLATVAPDVLAPLAAVIDRCLATDPAARPASAEIVRDELDLLHGVYAPLLRDDADPTGPSDGELLVASISRIGGASADGFANRFYARVFELEPSLRAMFPPDLTRLRRKLMTTLDTVVRNLAAPESVVPMLEELGGRHRAYGVRAEHFIPVGRALLDTLAADENDQWTPRLARAWVTAYERIAEHVVRGLGAGAPAAVSLADTVVPPDPRYVVAGDVSIAYQTFGRPGRDLVYIPGWVSHLELSWQGSQLAGFLSALGRFARVVVLDQRGTGLSDRTTAELGLDTRLADLLAVLDDARVERAIVVGCADSAALAAVLAATHPERVRALVLYGVSPSMLARGTVGVDFDAIHKHWGEPLFVERHAPSHASDERFRAWWARYLRSSASPAGAVALLRAASRVDVRTVLPAIRVPTLILHRKGDRAAPIDTARFLTGVIPGARLVELDGDDHLPFAGDRDAVVAAIQRFVREMPTIAQPPLEMVTVLAVRADDPRVAAEVIAARGLVAPSPSAGITVAVFDVPAAALRVARRLAATGSRFAAGLDVGVTSVDDGEADVVTAACDLAAVALLGHVRISARARAFAWDASISDPGGPDADVDLS